MAFEKIYSLSELWDGEKVGLSSGSGVRVMLVRIGDDVFAFEDRCAHLGVRVSGGKLENCVLTCPAHEWTYDARTGEGVNPSGARLRRFPVRIEADDVLIDTEENV